MELNDIIQSLRAEELVPAGADHPGKVHDICAADLLSDILATTKHDFVILTGLVTPQVIRVAEAVDALGVVIVRGKTPPQTTLDAARDEGIPVWRSPLQMFESCAVLAPLVADRLNNLSEELS